MKPYAASREPDILLKYLAIIFNNITNPASAGPDAKRDGVRDEALIRSMNSQFQVEIGGSNRILRTATGWIKGDRLLLKLFG